jgi:hypothetical protein
MAYSLKAAWASRAIACVAVDDDNTTITDFVSGNSITAHADLTVGTATWKGNNRAHFTTLSNGSFGFKGITWNPTKPTVPYSSVASFFIILSDYTSTSGGYVIDDGSAGNQGVKVVTGKLAIVNVVTGATSIAASTKQSLMAIGRRSGTCEIHYGLESGSMASDASATDGGPWLANFTLNGYGGCAGQGNFVAKTHLFLITNDAINNTDRDALHSDFVGTLFDGGAAAGASGWFRRRAIPHLIGR